MHDPLPSERRNEKECDVTNEEIMSALVRELGETWVGVEGNDVADLDPLSQNILSAHCLCGVRAVLLKLAEIGMSEEMLDEFLDELCWHRPYAFTAALRALASTRP
jgi:hypothetical protein